MSLGVSESTAVNTDFVYPNPAKDFVYFHQTKMNNNEKVSIYSPSGQLMQETQLLGNSIQISHLAPGIYFIQLKSTNNSIYFKLVKE